MTEPAGQADEAPPEDYPSDVFSFADGAWTEYLGHDPMFATTEGIETWDDRLSDPSPAGRADLMSTVSGWDAQIDRLAPGVESDEDEVTLGLMRAITRQMRDSEALRLWQMDALDQIHGPQTLVSDLARFQRTDTSERFDALVARLEALPGWLAAHRANIESGISNGRAAAPEVIDRCLDQAERLMATPAGESPLLLANDQLPDEQRAVLVDAVEALVSPSLRDWRDMLRDYRSSTREGAGLCYLPDGDAVYRHYVLTYTNLPEDPQSLRDYGLERLDEIEAAESAIAAELGHGDVNSLRRFLDADPANHAPDPATLVALAEGWIKRAELEAPKWFRDPPDEPCEVRAVEPQAERESPAGFYYPPADDGSRPGLYFLNTYDPASRPLHQVVPMTYHEAVPGHHFQLTIERSLRDLPAFRRYGAMLACGAYVEGWALYSERLAAEMGLYRTPLERFGAWESEAHRAARLVVDTGLHAFGWTRAQSIDILIDRAGLSRLEAEIETDRYIAWPGQALSYMTGQREILDLRARLEARDGDRFDHRGFHDAVLSHGSLPLDVMREYLPRWVAPRPD